MKTLILIAVIALGLAASIVVAGFLLPQTRSGTSSRTIDAAPDLVRATILDVESQPSWRPRIKTVVREPGGGWTEVTADGERIGFRLLEDSDRRITLQFESNRGYTGRWAADLAPAGAGGTRLTVVEEATTPSPIGRILSRLFFDPKAFATAYLDALSAEVARRRKKAE